MKRLLPVIGFAISIVPAVAGSPQTPPTAPQAAKTIAPGPSLVVEGIPEVPASLASEVKRYTESRSAGLANWHPTRRELLITTRFGNTAQVHRVAMPGGARTQLTFFDEPIGGATYEPTSGKYFLFGRDTGGDEFSQIYRYDVADGAVTLLTDGGRSQNGGIRWSSAGDRMAFASTKRNGTDRDIYVMDPLKPQSARLVLEVSGGGFLATDWSPDDTKLLVQQYISVNKSDVFLVDVAAGTRTALTDPQAKISYSGGEFTPDGRRIVLTSDEGSEFSRLALLDIASRKVTPLVTDINWDVEGFDLSDDGKTVAFVTNEAGLSKLYLYDMDAKRYRPVQKLPIAVIGGLEWHRNSQELGFSAGSARAPSDVYSLTVSTGQVTRWTESELGGQIASQLSDATPITWKTFDGRELSGFYYKPAARFTGKRPVIINIHGGPEGQSRPGFMGRSNYFLNELGVAIIFPNVRGSTGYGKTFVDLDNGLKRLDSVKDIGSLLDWIAVQPELDASRVMVTGGSYGGYMTLAVATMYNDRIACAVDIVGVSNFNTFLKNTESYRRDLRRVEYGDERVPEIRDFFEKTAPLNNAEKISKPLFVIQGGNDPRVPRTEAEQMVAKVRGNASPVWYLMASDEGHGFRKKPNVDYQFYATVLFVRQFLLGSGGTPTASR
jgi:dipeptidyl aminopeptidase/acylaminoacyl peptidase